MENNNYFLFMTMKILFNYLKLNLQENKLK